MNGYVYIRTYIHGWVGDFGFGGRRAAGRVEERGKREEERGKRKGEREKTELR